MKTHQQLVELFTHYMEKSCTPAERQELFRLLADPSYEEQLHQISEAYEAVPASGTVLNNDTSLAIWNAVRNDVLAPSVPVRSLHKRWWWAAAAAVLLAAGFGAWQFMHPVAGTPVPVAAQPTPGPVRSGSEGVYLKLASGKAIQLDSLGNGQIADQAGTSVMLQDGNLVYAAVADAPVLYNTMTTLRGSRFKLSLPDGTKVWLNAASSIRYPTTFRGNERKVMVQGEAYFEVAQNKEQPFIVTVNHQEIEVLGTRFNINAYSNEPVMTTTLLEGKVKIGPAEGTGKSLILQPGEECVTTEDGQKTVNKVDVETAASWVNGRFYFKSADLGMVLRQVERWYDVRISYDKSIQAHFSGSIYITDDFSEILKLIAFSSNVKFSVDGKNITVKAR
ncbi:MAG: FecR domain-containing protein [Candidatus Pseudobacter hemicellulosilyticus]|uniref:FecR domain-containing protein n=1 Tax=Candidatus Pseudobacter hemicellulosilyticus TaxID=3121375 RepID=A0AAJ5WP58_9BACT|nr:MAG: FecR domain-containing protein [Pseudobacter sp.]